MMKVLGTLHRPERRGIFELFFGLRLSALRWMENLGDEGLAESEPAAGDLGFVDLSFLDAVGDVLERFFTLLLQKADQELGDRVPPPWGQLRFR